MKRIALLSALLVGSASYVASGAEPRLHAPLPFDQAKARALDWAANRNLSDKTQIDAIGKLWVNSGDPIPADEVHDRIVQTAAAVEPAVRELMTKCRFGSSAAPEIDPKTFEALDPFIAQNTRAYVAKFMAQAGYFDESQQLAATIDVQQLADPATYYFFKAVCEHRLLMKKDGLATLQELRKNTSNVPVRYSSVAELMEVDLNALEEKSLNEVSRLMSDAERRLGLGRGGERVQKVEEDIVARLDEIIKKMEQQQGGGGGGGGGGSGGPNNSNQSGGPAGDSRVKGTTAPGEVDKKDIGNKSGWGALPPKEQAKAKNIIDRELPPHYRNAIEQYLKKLATRPESAPSK